MDNLSLLKNLQLEYDQLYVNKHQNYSGFFFKFGAEQNEYMVLGLIKYVIEYYLKWSPAQARDLLDEKTLKQMKLHILFKFIRFPKEITLVNRIKYLLSKIYPTAIRISKRDLVNEIYKSVLADNGKKYPKDFFLDTDGRLRACICLQYMISNFMVCKNIEELYETFAGSKVNNLLKKYKLNTVCSSFFDSPVEFLHRSLPDNQKDEFLYNFFTFKIKYNEVAKSMNE